MRQELHEIKREARMRAYRERDEELRKWVAKKYGEEYANLPAHEHGTDRHGGPIAASQTGMMRGCRRCDWLMRQPIAPKAPEAP